MIQFFWVFDPLSVVKSCHMVMNTASLQILTPSLPHEELRIKQTLLYKLAIIAKNQQRSVSYKHRIKLQINAIVYKNQKYSLKTNKTKINERLTSTMYGITIQISQVKSYNYYTKQINTRLKV